MIFKDLGVGDRERVVGFTEDGQAYRRKLLSKTHTGMPR